MLDHFWYRYLCILSARAPSPGANPYFHPKTLKIIRLYRACEAQVQKDILYLYRCGTSTLIHRKRTRPSTAILSHSLPRYPSTQYQSNLICHHFRYRYLRIPSARAPLYQLNVQVSPRKPCPSAHPVGTRLGAFAPRQRSRTGARAELRARSGMQTCMQRLIS